MRKFLSALLVFMVMFGLFSCASGEVDSQWKTGQYLDEFDEPTGEEFAVINTEGTFSNIAAHKEFLSVKILVDLKNVEFYMLEYGKFELTSIGKNSYTIKIKDNDDVIHQFTGHLDDSTGRITVDFHLDTAQGKNETREEILSIFSKGGKIRFSITEDSSSRSNYVFSINNANNFNIMRRKSAKIAINYMGACSEGIIPVVSDDKMGAITINGDIVVPTQYDVVSGCKDGMIRVFSGEAVTLDGGNRIKNGKGKLGFYNSEGTMVIDSIYDNAYDFQDGFAFVQQNSKWGAIDKQGNVIIHFEYDYVVGTSDGIGVVYKGELNKGIPVEGKGKYYFIDKTGAVIADDFEDARTFKEGLAVVKTKGKYGYINHAGELVIPAKLEDANDFSEGKAIVFANGKYIIIDPSGKTIAECEKKAKDIQFIGNFSDGMAYVDNKNYRYGFIDENGKEAVPCQYKFMREYTNGYAPVKKEDEKWGIIDKAGNTVVPFKYDEIDRCGDYYSVRTYATRNSNGIGAGGTYGLIDATGNEILESRYLQIRYGDGFYTASTDEVWTVFDKDLKKVYPAE